MFDINFVTQAFNTCRRNLYLDKFKNASKDELLKFKKEIITHGKTNKQHQAFSDVKNYSTHKALISAINYELLKRSKLYKFYRATFPIRKWLANIRNGSNLIQNEYFGTLCCSPKHVKYIWHVTLQELLKKLFSFWCNNWYKIIIAGCAIGTFIFLWREGCRNKF